MNSFFSEYINAKTEYKKLSKCTSNQSGGGSVKKWKELEHNGVMFYPEYIPHNIPIIYGTENEKIILNPEAEEYITYYVNTRFDKYRNEKFKKNFFKDWKNLLTPTLRKKIVNFNQCNFDDIKLHIDRVAEKRKEDNLNLSKEEKDDQKKIKDIEKDKYRIVKVDGTEQVIDNFLVEPPTIFTGRGNHPLSGSIKHRIYPINITLNVGPNMKIPVPVIEGYDPDKKDEIIAKNRWGEIISDNTLEWIASWQNNVTNKYNYARFGRKSKFKMKSDEVKFDLARKLKKKIKKIREKNMENMLSSDDEIRQLATALYLIDDRALRIGNEKKEEEADTVGVTTLKKKNVNLLENNIIKLDFLGKDSIRYVNKFKVPETVYNNIKDFLEHKENSDDLFDKITADLLNKYIKKFMKKLTSKVFRTFNASFLMQNELKKITTKYKDYEGTDKLQKILHEYEMANLRVAKLCNHQKETSKSSICQLEKTQSKINDLQKTLRKLQKDKEKASNQGKKTTALNKRINTIRKKIQLLKKKKSLQTESKSLSAGTSKTNYIDPRITIAFLKKNGIFDNIDNFFTKTHQNNFKWAMDVDANFIF